MSDRELPLAGITVIDFTQVQFGPIATQILGDYGANVIKVERPDVGDLTRSTDVKSSSIDDSAYFLSLNRNKRSVALNMKDQRSGDILHRLLRDADVVVENFRPGVMDRLGYGYEALRELYPGLIYAAGSGFGATGPFAHKGGQDMLAQAISGAAYHARGKDGRPRLYPLPFADFGAGMSLVQGILLALLQRAKDGLGQRIDVSLLDSVTYLQLQEYTQWNLRKFEVNWESQNLAGCFRTADGWIAVVGMFKPDPLRNLCAALGVDDLSLLEGFTTLEQQLARREELWTMLEPAFERYTTEECTQRLDAQDVLSAPILDYDEFPQHEQAINNRIFRVVEHPLLGEITLVEAPIRMSAAPAESRPFTAPPRLGQHSVEVLTELGFTADEVQGLFDDGVVRRP